MTACAWVHLKGEATRRAEGELCGEAARIFFFPSSLSEQLHRNGEALTRSGERYYPAAEHF